VSDDVGLIIHAGAPKCGSSSLQSALSRSPDFAARDGRRYAYCVLQPDGTLLSGDGVRRRAAASPFGYASSPNVPEMDLRAGSAAIAGALGRLRAERGIPILSSEAWIHQAAAVAESGLVAKAGGRAHVVVFVRPPVEWLNSAWWQWGVWSGARLDQFLKRNIHGTRWHVHATAWSRIEGVEKVTLRLAGPDVVDAFYGLLGAEPGPRQAVNQGIPPAFLSFLLRNRDYRDGPHAAHVEFIVSRHLGNGRNRAPWALSQERIGRIFESVPHLPGAVQALLPPDDAEAMEADRRWWDKAAYRAREVESLDALSTGAAVIALHAALIAKLGPVARWQLRGSAARLRSAVRAGQVDAADREIARAVDVILARDRERRMTRRAEA